MLVFLFFLRINLTINVAHPVFLMHTQSLLSGYAPASESHDPSENIRIFWFAAQETFVIFFSENNCTTEYVCGNHENLIYQN